MSVLDTTIQALLSASFSGTSDLSTVLETIVQPYTIKLPDGTGNNQANGIWSDRRTLTTITSDLLDLFGVLTDSFGAVLNFTKIRAVLIVNTETAAGRTLTIGNAGATPCALWFSAAAQSELLHRGGMSLHVSPADGWTIVNGVSDIFKIDNPTAFSITYDIYIVGTR